MSRNRARRPRAADWERVLDGTASPDNDVAKLLATARREDAAADPVALDAALEAFRAHAESPDDHPSELARVGRRGLIGALATATLATKIGVALAAAAAAGITYVAVEHHERPGRPTPHTSSSATPRPSPSGSRSGHDSASPHSSAPNGSPSSVNTSTSSSTPPSTSSSPSSSPTSSAGGSATASPSDATSTSAPRSSSPGSSSAAD